MTSATGLLFSGSSGAEDQSLTVSIDSTDLPPTCRALPILPINQINPARSVPNEKKKWRKRGKDGKMRRCRIYGGGRREISEL